MNRLAFVGRRSLASVGRVSKQQVAFRAMSSIGSFNERERGEEARYFRQEEDRLKAEARAKFEELLAKDHSDAKRQELLGQLVSEEKKGFLEANGLNNSMFWVPLIALGAIPALANDVLVLSNESYLLAIASLTYGSIYNMYGPKASETLDSMSKQDAEEYKAVDDAILAETIKEIETVKEVTSINAGVKDMFQLVDDLHTIEAESLNNAAAQQYREAVVKKLDSLIALEEKISYQVKTRMVEFVKADVQKQFEDKKAKEAALEQALAVLAGGKNAKLGNDVVGNAFKTSISNYRANYSKQAPEKDSILLDLEREITNIAQAPHIQAAGGNVYETHPIVK